MTTTMAAAMAHERLSQARAKLTQLGKEYDTELQRATGHDDDRLTREGLRQKRNELAQAVRERYAQTFAALRSVIDDDADLIREHLEEQRPHVAHEAGALLRSQSKWDQVRLRLESGMPMTKIIEGADTETALAIREWAPAWLEARSYAEAPGGLGSGEPVKPDPDALRRSVDDRLVDLNPGEFSNAIRYARTAEQVAAASRPLLDHWAVVTSGVTGGSSGLGAAVAARFAANDATRGYTDPEPTGHAVA